MINKDKLHSLIEQYKKDFASFWVDERYKWVAVKHFQDSRITSYNVCYTKLLR